MRSREAKCECVGMEDRHRHGERSSRHRHIVRLLGVSSNIWCWDRHSRDSVRLHEVQSWAYLQHVNAWHHDAWMVWLFSYFVFACCHFQVSRKLCTDLFYYRKTIVKFTCRKPHVSSSRSCYATYTCCIRHVSGISITPIKACSWR